MQESNRKRRQFVLNEGGSPFFLFLDQYLNEEYSVNFWIIVFCKTMFSNAWAARLKDYFFESHHKVFENLVLKQQLAEIFLGGVGTI